MQTPSTMTSLRSASATETLPADMTLDLVRQHLDIQFRLHISRDAKSDNFTSRPSIRHSAIKLTGAEETSSLLERTDHFRFRIPLVDLHCIHEIENDAGGFSLLISQAMPPNFWRMIGDITKTFQPRERSWNEWDTWFRQTDIVYDRDELKTSPIALRKPDPIIDLGI